MPVINSDALRKTIGGKLGPHIAPFNQRLYSADMTEKTYTRMMRGAERQILDGKGAILDATFGDKRQREKAARLAERLNVPVLMIHCYASDEITKQRLDQRLSEGKDLSDGRWEIYLAQKAAGQPNAQLPAKCCLELDTNAAIEQLVRASEGFVRSGLENM
jgi:predicted kinase